MAKLKNTITIKIDLRPCWVAQNTLRGTTEKRAALFHKWIDRENETLKLNVFRGVEYVNRVLKEYHEKHVIPNDAELIKCKHTFALVEYDDGTVAEVDPQRIIFVDKKIKEYAF